MSTIAASVSEGGHATARGEQPREAGRAIAALELAIAGVWVWFGLSKVFAWKGFLSAVEGHGVLPGAITPFAWGVPAIEIGLGLAVVILGTRRVLASAVLGAGMIALVALSAYLAMIPEEALAKVGCGCGGGGVPAETTSHVWPLARNAGFFTLHGVTLLLLLKPRKTTRSIG